MLVHWDKTQLIFVLGGRIFYSHSGYFLSETYLSLSTVLERISLRFGFSWIWGSPFKIRDLSFAAVCLKFRRPVRRGYLNGAWCLVNEGTSAVRCGSVLTHGVYEGINLCHMSWACRDLNEQIFDVQHGSVKTHGGLQMNERFAVCHGSAEMDEHLNFFVSVPKLTFFFSWSAKERFTDKAMEFCASSTQITEIARQKRWMCRFFFHFYFNHVI